MMQRKIFLMLLSLASFFTYGQMGDAGFTINGKLTGVPDGTEIRLTENEREVGKAKIYKGLFTIKGKVGEPVLVKLHLGEIKAVDIYLENKTVAVSGNAAQNGAIKISGSAPHKDFEEFKKVFDPRVEKMSAIATKINSSWPGAERDSMMKEYTAIVAEIQSQIDKFIKAKPKSHVSPFVLYITSQLYDDAMLLENRYNMLDASIKSTALGTSLGEYIKSIKIAAVGTLAPEFSQADTLGNMVALSSFRGKYVLVDFWASWCGPCRNENPNVVASYHKFKDKKFTVLGVSLDNPGKKQNWIDAIHADNLTWTHVSDLKGWGNAVAAIYKVGSIPQNFLVDPDGKIVAKNLRGPALDSKLCELLGCN
jgi:peroxiredoxin